MSSFVFCTSSSPSTIDKSDVCSILPSNLPASILDVGKYNVSSSAANFLSSHDVNISRLDIGTLLAENVCSRVYSPQDLSTPARATINLDGSIRNTVSGGFPGSNGDLVVDNAKYPQLILGEIKDCVIDDSCF